MNMQIELALSTLVLPLALSFLVQKLSASNKQVMTIGVFITWLISYLWIAGIPSIPPKEAIEWSIYLSTFFIIGSLILKTESSKALLFGALSLLGIILIALPVIRHAPELQLFFELSFFALVVIFITYRMRNSSQASPALSLGISNGGLAIVAGLGGSLLIGQLAGALASALGAFAIYELINKLEQKQMIKSTRLLATLLSLLMLVVARIYAELPLVSVALLALSLILGLSIKWRFASALSLIAVIGSIANLLLTADQSSYY